MMMIIDNWMKGPGTRVMTAEGMAAFIKELLKHTECPVLHGMDWENMINGLFGLPVKTNGGESVQVSCEEKGYSKATIEEDFNVTISE